MKKKLLRNSILTAFCCVLIGSFGSIHGTQGSWTNNVAISPAAWDDNSNWQTNPAGTFPNGIGDAASIVTAPDNLSIFTTSRGPTNITLGSLYTNVNNLDLAFFTITFDNGGASANSNLFVSQFLIFETPAIINSPLDIYVASEAEIEFTPIGGISGGVAGANSITIACASVLGEVLFDSTNSYVGSTNVEGGTLILAAGFPTGAISIPGDLNIVGVTSQVLTETPNQFASTSNISINEQGFFDLLGTSQTFNSLSVGNGASITDGTNTTGTVILTDLSNPLSMTENSSVTIPTIVIENGGAVTYSNNVGGEGTLGSTLHPFTLNLNGNPVSLSNQGNNNFPRADLTIINADIINGILNINGFGTTLFTGQLSSLPPDIGLTPGCNISEGFVLMGGTNSPADLIGTIGTVQVTDTGVLLGFGVLGTSGQAKVVNSATVEPGNINDPGTLTISGSYTQSSIGTLLIQAVSSSFSSELVVEGDVSLDGKLIFQSLTGSTVVGETYVIISSTGPITGTFSSVNANLASGQAVNVIYNTNDVVAEIISSGGVCPVCPSFSLLPPSDLTATLVKDDDFKKTKFIRLEFYPSPSLNVKEYNIYRNDKFIGKVKNMFKFDDHRKIKKGTEYTVTSVTTAGVESTPAVTFFNP